MSVYHFDDRPLLRPDADRLGFAKPADLMARYLGRMAAPAGFVSAVTGEWGSGKTSFLNFVAQSDELHNSDGLPPLEVLRFEPWLVSGQNELIGAFFKELAGALATPSSQAVDFLKALGSKAAAPAKDLAKLAAKVGFLADQGLISKLLETGAEASIDAMVNKLEQEASLQQTYAKLENALRSADRRFLILIDDIDRLKTEEVRTLLNMVKSVGRLPHVIYLLSYDRQVIEAALPATVHGPRYLEKIVQHEVPLPLPLPGGVLGLLDGQVEDLLGHEEETAHWSDMVRYGLRQWVTRPRDAMRLAGSFRYVAESLEGEVDTKDILVLEAIKLFRPEVYNWIRQSENIIFGSTLSLVGSKKEELVSRFTQTIPEPERESTIRVLCALFPQLAKSFEGNRYSSHRPYYEAKVRGHVQSEPAYRAYFAFGLPEGQIPRARLDALVSIDVTAAQVTELVTDLMVGSRPHQVSFASELTEGIYYRLVEGALSPAGELLDGLGQVYNRLLATNRDAAFGRAPSTYTRRIFRRVSELWGSDRTLSYLETALAGDLPMSFVSLIFDVTAVSLDLIENDEDIAPLVDANEFDALLPKLVKKLEHAAESGELANIDRPWTALRLWSVFDSSIAVRQWTTSIVTSNADALYRFGLGMVRYSTSSSGKHHYEANGPVDDSLYDPDAIIEAAARHSSQLDQDSDRYRLIKALVDGADVLRPNEDEYVPDGEDGEPDGSCDRASVDEEPTVAEDRA